MKIQSMLLLFALVGVLLASSLNKDNSEEALLQEDDAKNGMAAFLAKLATLKTSPSEDEAAFWGRALERSQGTCWVRSDQHGDAKDPFQSPYGISYHL